MTPGGVDVSFLCIALADVCIPHLYAAEICTADSCIAVIHGFLPSSGLALKAVHMSAQSACIATAGVHHTQVP